MAEWTVMLQSMLHQEAAKEMKGKGAVSLLPPLQTDTLSGQLWHAG